MLTEERMKRILKNLHEAVARFEEEDAVKWSRIALEEVGSVTCLRHQVF